MHPDTSRRPLIRRLPGLSALFLCSILAASCGGKDKKTPDRVKTAEVAPVDRPALSSPPRV